MRMRDSWVGVAKSVALAGLACCLLVATAYRNVGGHAQKAPARPSPVAAHQESKISAANNDSMWREAYGKLPLSFEENQGQTAREVRYLSHGSGYELFLTPQEAVLALRSKVPHDLSPLHRTETLRALRKAQRSASGQLTAVRLRLEGANADAQIEGMDQLPGKSNYFVGNDPKKWHTDVPSYARVKYTGIYPGVDLVFYGNQQRLEYDFVVATGADPSAIAFDVEGANRMQINSRGDLVLSVAGGEVELQKPVVYQNINGKRLEIAGRYVLAGNGRVSFGVDSYDRREPLILDPILNYSTYLGGGGTATLSDSAFAIAVDGSGNAYVAGQTLSTTFPAGAKGDGIAAPAANSGASFVAELNPTGTQLLYSAYLIGTTTNPGDTAFGIALDPSGKVYVTGSTFATDFPTMSGLTVPGNATNGVVYVSKLDPTVNGTSSLLYSTFLGGTGGDFGNAISADAGGNAYVVGGTDSTDFRTKNPFQSAPASGTNIGTCFVARIDTTLVGDSSLIYSTYLGGNATNAGTAGSLGYGDQAFGVAADSAHNAYVVGSTTSNDSVFITTGTAYQSAPPGANVLGSAFLSKIDTTQTGTASLVYSTYLAGSVEDQGNAITLGPANVAYITGTTSSTDFPSPGATAGSFSSKGSAFVTLVDTTKSGSASVPYSTYLGGSQPDTGFGIRADASGIAYVVGTASSNDLGGAGTFKRLGSFQPTLSNLSGTPFFMKLNPGGAGAADLLYATYFGGSGNGSNADQGFGIAIDSANPPNAYLTGQTFSTDMPVLTPLPTGGSLIPPSAAFVAKLSPIPTFTITPSPFNFGTQPVGVTSTPQTFTLTNNNSTIMSFTSIAAVGVSPVSNTDFAVASDACSPSVAAGAQCTVTVTFTPAAAGARTGTLVFTDNDVNSPQNVSLSGTGSATAPGVGLAPTSLAFGNQALTTTSTAKTVTLTNIGTAALTINSIAASGDFAETSTGATACPISPATLAASANCTINVTFTPTVLGARAGNLTITDNAAGSPQMVPLTGTGTAAAAPGVGLAPTSLAFGNQALNTPSAAKPVTLTNTGTAALIITSIAASGDFAETSTGATACPISPATLAASANCTINVTFTPTALGARAGNLTITDNAAGSPHIVPLTGTGTGTPDFALAVTPSQTVKNGTPAMYTVTITPSGGFSSAVNLTCTEPASLTLSTCTLNPASITPPVLTSTLTVTSTALVMPPTRIPTPTAPPRQVVPLLLALMLLLSLVWARRPRLRLALATAALTLIAITGCNGLKHQHTSTGTYTLTVTGTSGALSHSQTFTLTLN